MKICVLVKEVPDVSVARRIDPVTGRLDRSGETTLNHFDAHAVEAAIRLRETPQAAVEEIVVVTMGPESAARALLRAVALGADRSVHLCDPALAGSDLIGTGYALASVVARERPDLVLLGQQSADGESYALGPIIGENLGTPSLSQVTAMELHGSGVRCERQAEYGYDTVEVRLPAVISVSEAINEPRYPSLKGIMAARSKPVQRLTAVEAGIDPRRVGHANAQALCFEFTSPPERDRGRVIEGRDPDATVDAIVGWLEQRRLLS